MEDSEADLVVVCKLDIAFGAIVSNDLARFPFAFAAHEVTHVRSASLHLDLPAKPLACGSSVSASAATGGGAATGVGDSTGAGEAASAGSGVSSTGAGGSSASAGGTAGCGGGTMLAESSWRWFPRLSRFLEKRLCFELPNST
jgi:hypothetical protein